MRNLKQFFYENAQRITKKPNETPVVVNIYKHQEKITRIFGGINAVTGGNIDIFLSYFHLSIE